jgi:hypothetical protein
MAVRLPLGIKLVPSGCTCMHAQSKDQSVLCGKDLDVWGDHCVMCNTGPFITARRARLNNILAQASRDGGYAALMEQAVPEFGLRKRQRHGRVVHEGAVLDVELFGHPLAPDRLLDGTVRHPAASHVISKSATELGAAASEGSHCVEQR